MSKLEVKDLSLIYGSNRRQAMKMLEKGASKDEILQKTRSVVAVNHANFSINDGEIFVIMGLSGSGKSSLLRCLNMLNIPTAGEILVDGEDITKLDKKGLLEVRRQKIGMVFQHFALLPHKTILDNVAFGLEIQNLPLKERHEKAREVLDMVGLSEYADSYPSQLSGGMQQRVGIARAIANDSEILLMDEAFSALDPLIRSQMQDELIEIQQKLKKTIVFITHDLDEALKLGDTIAIMKDGVIVQQDTSENILLNPANDYVKSFIDEVDSTKVITAAGLMKPFKQRIRLDKDGPANAVRQMERFNHHFLPMVDNMNRFQGYIRLKDARRLLEEGKRDLTPVLLNIPHVSSDTPLSETLPLFAHHTYPIAVLDERDRPVGYLRYISVVEMMAGSDDQTVIDAKLFGKSLEKGA
ncbi:MAG: glycine betaine/L-proline ABC transporter ATP-binding protein [Xanthomonadaceae bacterium]|nr:glycine betaine/L-proline ABC transporter ATP-binding protein [Xanthomonadaceae bacterium]